MCCFKLVANVLNMVRLALALATIQHATIYFLYTNFYFISQLPNAVYLLLTAAVFSFLGHS